MSKLLGLGTRLPQGTVVKILRNKVELDTQKTLSFQEVEDILAGISE